MIITGITADNLLKYNRLELNDLPPRGMIAVSGLNESGKSTIGETICFALFGRTFSVGAEELEKVIRWGENDCRAMLRFRLEGGAEYALERSLDRNGNHGVRLSRQGEEEPMAIGVRPVEEAVNRLLGYGFEEYVESYYLAQREITAPHPHSDAVKRMAGLSDLEAVTDEFVREIGLQQQMIEADEEGIEGAEAALKALNIREGVLEFLQQDREAALNAEQEMRRHMDRLRGAADAYQEQVPMLPRLERKRYGSGLASMLLLVLTAFTLALWAVFDLGSGAIKTALVFGLLALPFLALALYYGQVITGLRQQAEQLAECVAAGHRFGQGIGDPAPVGDEVEHSGVNASGTSVELEAGEITELCQRISSLEAEPEEVVWALSRELDWMESGLQYCSERVQQLDRELDEERERLEEAARLQRKREELERNLAAHQQQVLLRERALELLTGAAQQLSRRFNRDLQELVGRTLPLFTEGRYEHLQVDENLTVRAFSSEKRDFIDLEEVSSGTQRQIMLALRLALSQELVNRTAADEQFIFLDEPFAFFDAERTRNALRSLPELSDQISQIWIVAQQFPDDEPFALSVPCEREQDTLVQRVKKGRS